MPLPRNAWMNRCRRQRKRWTGSGPWQARPLAEILAHRHPPGSWHEAETVDGPIASVAHPAAAFPRGHPLLGQKHCPIVMETGQLRYQDGGIARAHTTTFWSLAQAGVLGYDGLVYCPDARAAVAETARTIFRSARNHPELGFDRPITQRLAGTSLLLPGVFGHAHYHLLWDLLAKLALFPDALRPAIDHYLVGAPATPGVRAWLDAAWVPRKRIVWLEGGSHLRCDQVIFSNLPTECSQPRPAVLSAVRTLLAAPTQPGPGRWLWLSRRQNTGRHLVWEQQLLAAFPRFERLDLADIPARPQIETFADAGVIAGPHGSGFRQPCLCPGRGGRGGIFPSRPAHRSALRPHLPTPRLPARLGPAGLRPTHRGPGGHRRPAGLVIQTVKIASATSALASSLVARRHLIPCSAPR